MEERDRRQPERADKPTLLVVDDDDAILRVLTRFARTAGFEAVACGAGSQAFEHLRRRPIDVALVDLRMPDIDGIGVLKRIKEQRPGCEVILMSGAATVESVVEAIKLGALDYLTKPLDFDRLTDLMRSVVAEVRRRQNLLEIESGLAHQLGCGGMLGVSPVMQHTFSLLRRLAPYARTALITGETGTGKELAARALHQLGPRREKAFVTINCSALVETLFESEVFGHVRGAFTGAATTKPGLFENADGGTLFLDEIGELALPLQAKLLRVLETGEVQRVGALQPRRVDVHVIAATNRDLQQEIVAERFRSDLYFRLSIVHLTLPTLRERREDIPYLAATFIREFATRLRKPLGGISAAAERLLLSRQWMGNVRELRNTLERACILATGELITEAELEFVDMSALEEKVGVDTMRRQQFSSKPAPSRIRAEDEREAVLAALEHAQGNKAAAARSLGLSRRAFYRRLERHQVLGDSA